MPKKQSALLGMPPADAVPKVNSRVTKAHVDRLNGAMDIALDDTMGVSERLGYVTFAVSSVLNDIGISAPYLAVSAKMWANFGVSVK